MDRRSWPWKKKSSEKTLTASVSLDASSAGKAGNKDDTKITDYVKISVESYSHLSEMEVQVKILNEKLTLVQSEINTKENLVKQHAKVAEEAVSGWEKAEAEASALKVQLESTMLLKVTAENQASHLDGALKECMMQIQNLKEEHERILHEITSTKSKQMEALKFDFEAKITDLEQELLSTSAENSAISRSLQERSNMLLKITEEKSQAEYEIEFLKTNIQSCEKEISSLRYELHMVSKELEIRNEEKNISLRSAEVANKQHLESVKKLTKLEVECQRLRVLVRKKLPGAAAVAQMKLEVENLSRDYGETIQRRSPTKNSNQIQVAASEFSMNSAQHMQRETEFLTARLLAMEEETKMLKEALSNRNSELQASRNLYAETESKLCRLEAQLKDQFKQQSLLLPKTESSMDKLKDQNKQQSLLLPNMESCTDKNREKIVDNGVNSSNPLEFMDDFLEMERLAHGTDNSNKSIFVPNVVSDGMVENTDSKTTIGMVSGRDLRVENKSGLDSFNERLYDVRPESDLKERTLMEIKSRIALIVESQGKEIDLNKRLEIIKGVIKDVENELLHRSVLTNAEKTQSLCSLCSQNPLNDASETTDSVISSATGNKLFIHEKQPMDSELTEAISRIRDFILSFGKEAKVQTVKCLDDHEYFEKIGEFSVTCDGVLNRQISLVDFVLGLSVVLAAMSKICVTKFTEKDREREDYISDCIDKVALLEKEVIKQDLHKERSLASCLSSNPDGLQEGNLDTVCEVNLISFQCSKEECKKLRLEEDSMRMDLARCNEELRHSKLQLVEMEQLITELKSQLASSQKSNSLAETQLKCMAESYESLETRAHELATEINLVRAKAELLDNEVHEEKRGHQDALAKCKYLEEQMQRMGRCSKCSSSSATDIDDKIKKEREIAAAAEKLAECQETIYLLGKQLKSLRASPSEHPSATQSKRYLLNEQCLEKSLSTLSARGMHSLQELDHLEMDNGAASRRRLGGAWESTTYNIPLSPSETEESSTMSSPNSSRHPKQRSIKSTSHSSPNSTPEKHHHGFSRFLMRGKTVR